MVIFTNIYHIIDTYEGVMYNELLKWWYRNKYLNVDKSNKSLLEKANEKYHILEKIIKTDMHYKERVIIDTLLMGDSPNDLLGNLAVTDAYLIDPNSNLLPVDHLSKNTKSVNWYLWIKDIGEKQFVNKAHYNLKVHAKKLKSLKNKDDALYLYLTSHLKTSYKCFNVIADILSNYYLSTGLNHESTSARDKRCFGSSRGGH